MALLTSRSAWLCVVVAGSIVAGAPGVRYLHWAQIQPVASSIGSAGDRLPDFAGDKEWDAWIRQRDYEIRGRNDRAVEDSISALIVFGSSFTSQPRLAGEKEAVNAAGGLTPVALARIDAFVQALDESDDERFGWVLDFLKRRRVTEDELRAYLIGILRRSALDRARDQRVHEGPPLVRDFATAETLNMLKTDGRLPARIHRIAILAPVVDFSGGPEGNDFNPVQTTQPFAILEAALRLGAAQPGDVQLVIMDLHPFSLLHLRGMAARVRGGKYVLQLPRNPAAGWNAALVSYWTHFGEVIGSAATPAPIPAERHDVETRAITVKAQFGSRINVEDLNPAAQTTDAAPGQGFDLVVALDAMSGYDRMEQSLALTSIAQMMNTGGIVLLGSATPAGYIPELEGLSVHHIRYMENGPARIDITAYRRR